MLIIGAYCFRLLYSREVLKYAAYLILSLKTLISWFRCAGTWPCRTRIRHLWATGAIHFLKFSWMIQQTSPVVPWLEFSPAVLVHFFSLSISWHKSNNRFNLVFGTVKPPVHARALLFSRIAWNKENERKLWPTWVQQCLFISHSCCSAEVFGNPYPEAMQLMKKTWWFLIQ